MHNTAGRLTMQEAPELIMDGSMVSEVRDPYPMFAAMRRSDGVARVEFGNHQFYLVLRYDDVSKALRDPETFSSSIMREVMGPVMGRTILEMNGRTHTVHRGLVSHAFRAPAIERYRKRLIAPLVDDLMAHIRRGGGRAELVRQLTSDFPLTVIARLLGVPIRDY